MFVNAVVEARLMLRCLSIAPYHPSILFPLFRNPVSVLATYQRRRRATWA